MMHRAAGLRFLSRQVVLNTTKRLVASASSDAKMQLPNPCIAMAPDSNHIICYHPEKPHPYEYTKPIDRTDPSFRQVRVLPIKTFLFMRVPFILLE